MTSILAAGASLRQALRLILEALRLATGYLGLAVLVASILMLTIPPLRAQLQHVHTVLVAALKPSGLRMPIHYTQTQQVDRSEQLNVPMAAEDLPWPLGADADAEIIDHDVSGSLAHLNFSRVLVDTEEQLQIPGVSNTQAEALRGYIARKYRIAHSAAGALIATVFKVGNDM